MSMAKKPPVHVLPRDEGWAVVREGNETATSVHPTQAEAAEAGREMARKDMTSFLLHAKDGHVRDRSDYSEDPSPQREEPEGPGAGTAGEAARTTGDVVDRASGIVEGTLGQLGEALQGATRGEASGENTDETEEASGLAYEERYAGYEVYDQLGKKFGKVDTLFLGEDDELEYVGVKTSPVDIQSTLIPAEVLTVDDQQRRLVVERSSDVIERGPTLADEEEVTPEFEERVRLHYGVVGATSTVGERGTHGGTYGSYYGGPPEGTAGVGTTETEEPSTTGSSSPTGEEELRVQRAEEELRVDTREREAGTLRVRKRVRIEHEQIEVPVKREEVYVERVPVEGEASEGEIGDDEVVVPIIEEEVVVSKRPVVKEEIRIRKDVVEDTEVVEEDVRREEIDVEDDTEERRGF
jgi:uncharacterized protein (TIGR02271 family)